MFGSGPGPGLASGTVGTRHVTVLASPGGDMATKRNARPRCNAVGGTRSAAKGEKRRPGLPVFVISAYGDADTVSTARECGAGELLTKPADFAKLSRDIMTVMTDATGETDDRATGRYRNRSSRRHRGAAGRARRSTLREGRAGRGIGP